MASANTIFDELETTDPGRVTTNWCLPPVNRPENSMTGVGSTNGAVWSDPARPLVGYQIRLAEHWVFAGTGLQNGDELGRGDNPNNNVVGYESDGLLMTGSIGCSDVVLVDATVGGAQVYLADGTGQFGDGQGQAGPRTVYSGIGTGSTHVVAGDFGPGCYTDLFCYDRNAGSAELHRYDRDGNFALVKQLTGMSKTWTQLAGGRLSGRGLSDVIAYDSGAGAIEISSFNTQGQFSRFARVTGFGSNWTHLGTGHFGPQYWYQDILLFDRTAGRLQIHSIDSLGKLSLLKETTGLGTTWSHVVIGKLLGSLYSDVLLYDEQNGIGEFRRSDGQGNLAVAQRYTGWSQGWTHITAGRFGGGRDQPGLMFYDSVQGRGELYAVGTGATLAPLGATLNLGTGSQQILSGHFESNARPQADGSDSSPANFMVLATSDLTDWGKPGWATMGIYRKGGTVFTAASTNWPRGLSLDGDRNAVDIITDNILTRLATVDSGAPVLKNASFETWSSDSTADFWLDEGSGSLQRETAVIKSGQAAARIDATAGETWISQDSLSFEQGVTYRLGCWVQSSHAGVTVRLQSTESWIDFAIAEHSGGGQWEYLTAIGQVSDAGPLVSGRAKFQVAAGSVAVFDDVKLEAL